MSIRIRLVPPTSGVMGCIMVYLGGELLVLCDVVWDGKESVEISGPFTSITCPPGVDKVDVQGVEVRETASPAPRTVVLEFGDPNREKEVGDGTD